MRKMPGRPAVKHLAQGDAELLGFFLGDLVPLGHLAQLGDGFLQPRIPAGGGGGRAVE